MPEKEKKKYISPEKPADLWTCSSYLARDLVSQYLRLGMLNQTDAVALYIAAGVIEFGRKGKTFFDACGTIAKALGLPKRAVRTYVNRLIEDGVIVRAKKVGDPLKERIWSIPSLPTPAVASETVSGNSTLETENDEGGYCLYTEGGTPCILEGTSSTLGEGTTCTLHLNESGSELKKESESGLGKVRATPQKPSEPNLPNGDISFNKEAEEGVQSTASLDDILKPKGFVGFYRQVAHEIGRKIPPSHSRAKDEKVAYMILRNLRSGLANPGVLAEAVRIYLAEIPKDDSDALLLSHFSTWLENSGADQAVLAYETARQEVWKIQEAEAEVKSRKRRLAVIHSSPSATRIMNAIVDAHGEEAFWDDQGIWGQMTDYADRITPQDADWIIEDIQGQDMDYISDAVFDPLYKISKRKPAVASDARK